MSQILQTCINQIARQTTLDFIKLDQKHIAQKRLTSPYVFTTMLGFFNRRNCPVRGTENYFAQIWNQRIKTKNYELGTLTTCIVLLLFNYYYFQLCYLLFIYLFHIIFAFSLFTFFFLTLEPSTVHFFYIRQLLYCFPPRIGPLIVGNIDLNYLQTE